MKLCKAQTFIRHIRLEFVLNILHSNIRIFHRLWYQRHFERGYESHTYSEARMRKSNSRGSMHLSVADGPNQDDWVAFQTTTFTNWARENIKKAHSIESVDDLTTAFEDGVSLIKLVEVVSGKKVNKYCRKPRIFSQKLDNIKLALDMLTDDGIKLVNIGKYQAIFYKACSFVLFCCILFVSRLLNYLRCNLSPIGVYGNI